MNVGDIVKVEIDGKQVEVELIDTHEPDPSVGIFGSPGWIVVTVEGERDLFIAVEGTVWEDGQEIGTLPELVAEAEAAAEREAEQAAEWEREEARYERRYYG